MQENWENFMEQTIQELFWCVIIIRYLIQHEINRFLKLSTFQPAGIEHQNASKCMKIQGRNGYP